MMVVKRNGEVVDFDSGRIGNAIGKAVKATGASVPQDLIDAIAVDITREVEERFTDFFPNVENIQDLVEKHLVKRGLYEVSKEYILYRAKRHDDRERARHENVQKSLLGKLRVKKRDGRMVLFELSKLKASIARASKGFEEDVSIDTIAKEAIKNIYDGVTTEEIQKALVLSSISFIEHDPAYSHVSARLFLQKLYKEVIGKSAADDFHGMAYREKFVEGIKRGVEDGLLDPALLEFDLERLSKGLNLERDQFFGFIGIQTLYERYFLKLGDTRLELPQSFWMRVAMGLALNEKDKNDKALEFYEIFSTLRFVSSTPTLFHSGTTNPQLSSCYLTTVEDDLKHIFKCLGDNAQLSKWSGGLGNDWTNLRATGSWIKTTKVESQGVIPFLKIANDVTMAINRSGKRRGATCAYLETWHLDIEDFLDLRKNTGDERRRTHDMNTANWIPDLFMKRVLEDGTWTLFSSEEVSDLHHIYGKKFEKRYAEYEEMARNGKIRKHKVVSAVKLWRKMLSMLFETGHPWITFKDPCNIRSPQDHDGVVHSSNLCTEITLNTSADETAVCNLGSVNLARHVVDGKLDKDLLARTVKTAIRMLDNVIEINFYPTDEARNSNLRHRPIGLGVMGLHDALYKLDLNFDSEAAVAFSDSMMELVAYHAILSSSEIAKEKGAYSSFKGSKWDRGIFPLDSLALLEEERGVQIPLQRVETLDWAPVREHVRQYGMRNSNTMAIAPTATISTIAGCIPTIEPIYKNIYVKANISGEFTVVNSYLVTDLKALGAWNDEMLDQLKYYDGSVQLLAALPDKLRSKYKEVFEIDTEWLVRHAAVRSKWIDQSQSLNLYMKGASGTRLHEMYTYAWKMGLKTTYYLRTLAASQIEKSTLDAAKYGFTQKREYHAMETTAPGATGTDPSTAPVQIASTPGFTPKLCRIDDPTCESCQ
ncbi:ribonucleoside-diphosphate reductase subunit alpha [Candidatus Micrarchaeota archaeon CG1_02_55_22]|nr:MAG: ribonucleoside-diphosphate reductase subunit alpha [Candidatus Micrarchaeota archaeon CG1_02_55_22]